jgi:hypothetical protein
VPAASEAEGEDQAAVEQRFGRRPGRGPRLAGGFRSPGAVGADRAKARGKALVGHLSAGGEEFAQGGAGLVGQVIQNVQVFLPAQPGGQPFYGLRLGQVGTEAQAMGQANGLQVPPRLGGQAVLKFQGDRPFADLTIGGK